MAKKMINLDFIKKKPVLSGAIIIGGGLVFYFLFMADKGGGSSASSDSGGYADKQIVAAQQVAAMNHQGMMQGQQIQGQIALAQIEGNTALAIADAQSDLQREMAALSLEAARLELAGNIEGAMIQADLEKYGMDRSSEIARLQIESQHLAMISQNEKEIALQHMMTQAQVNLAGLSAKVQQAGISAQENISRHTLDTTAFMASMAYETQIALGWQDVEKDRIEADVAKYGMKKKSSSDSAGQWASVALGAMALFSSIHIKSIDAMVKNENCLKAISNMPIDFWKYLEGTETADDLIHVGPYAQSFYMELGARDWSSRDKIMVVDYMGALTGAIKALEKRTNGEAN